MYLLLTIACLSLASHATEFQIFFDDSAPYNPCVEGSELYFFPHSTDAHQYYQCDESGNAYLRTCGTLVWDELNKACNWPSAVAARSPSDFSITTTTPPYPPTTPEQPSSTTIAASVSLCAPVNPCGEHGQCLEPLAADSTVRKRFACICDENWFGRLCDMQIDELTTPAPLLNFDQTQNISAAAATFSLPVFNEKDAKSIFYGLQGTNAVGDAHQLQPRMIDPKEKLGQQQSVATETPTAANLTKTASVKDIVQ